MFIKSSNKFSFNVVSYSILCLFLLNIFAVAGGSIFYFQSMGNLASKDLKERIAIAMHVEMKRLQETLVEYSYWDEGYEKSVLSVDQEWVEGNYGDYLLETYGFAFTVIVQNSVFSHSRRFPNHYQKHFT